MPGILARLLGRAEPPAEARSVGYGVSGFADAFGIAPTASGAHVSSHAAENLATVLACVNAISSVMASMTPRVYRATAAGRTELTAHPVARLTRRPNGDQTWPDFIEWVLAQVLLHGNAVAVVELDGAGRPTALVPLPWGTVQVFRLPSGRLAYDATQPRGSVRRYLDGEVFHLKDRSDDGVIGRSRISRAREVLGNATSLQDWTGAMWRNSVTPSGVMHAPDYLTPDQRTIAKTLMDNFRGAMRAGKTPLLEGGWKWEQLAVSPGDAEALASRRFSVEELCRLFQVPPPIVQDLSHGTFTNSREAGRWFAQFSLAPWARKIEAEFSRSVFSTASADCTLEIDMSDLLRGDAEARWQSHKIAVESGILDADEIREIEGWNPRPEGQKALPQDGPSPQPVPVGVS